MGRDDQGRASILLFHLSLLIPDPLSSCSIECVRPVRVHGRFPIWQLSFLLCPHLHHRGSEGFPNQLCSDICRHCTRLWRFGYCAGLYHTATLVGHKSVRFSLNLPIHRHSPSDCLHGRLNRLNLAHSCSYCFRPRDVPRFRSPQC